MKKNILIILVLGITLSLSGQPVWTLQKCIETALKNNLSIKSAQINVENNLIGLNEALHSRYPNLSIGSNVYWNFGRTIDPTSNAFTTSTFFNNGVNLNTGFSIYNGGRIRNNILKLKNDAKALENDLEQLKNDIALNVSSLYLNALFAKENKSIAQGNLTLTNNSLTLLKSLIDAGARAPNEALDIEAQKANDEQNLLVAQNNYINVIMQLKQLMLVNEDFDIEAPSNINITTDAEVITLDQLYSSALKTQPGIIADEMRIKSSDLGIKIAESLSLPSIGFGVSIGTNYSNQGLRLAGTKNITSIQEVDVTLPGFPTQRAQLGFNSEVPIFEKANYFTQFDNNLSYGVGLNISYPIFNNYQTKGGIERAKLNKKSALLSLENRKQDLLVKVQTALADARAAKLKLSSAEKAFTANQAAYENANERFKIGTINSFDLTNARTRLDNAKNNLLIAKYDHLFKIKIVEFYLGKGISI